MNPFNPFQTQQHQQQSYQNWTFPETQTNLNSFGSPPLASNGFFYASNMANGIITQPLPFAAMNAFGNPFMVSVLTKKIYLR